MSMDVWANMAILLLYGSRGIRQRYSAGLTGGQRGTPGFGVSQLGIRAKVNDYLGSLVGIELR